MPKLKTKDASYPEILLKTGAAHGGPLARSACLDALAGHYKMPIPFERGGLSAAEMAKRWEILAMSLAVDIFPAFNSRPSAGAPSRIQRSSIFPWAHEARLVQLVAALQIELAARCAPASRSDAFCELIGLLKKNPAPKWIFGRYKQTTSFAQAWKKIPKDVKTAPLAFLPGVGHKRQNGAGSGEGFRAVEAHRIWQELPSIPVQSARR